MKKEIQYAKAVRQDGIRTLKARINACIVHKAVITPTIAVVYSVQFVHPGTTWKETARRQDVCSALKDHTVKGTG